MMGLNLDWLNQITLKEIYPRIIKDDFFPSRKPMPDTKLNSINTVIQCELLSSLLKDLPDPRISEFSDWRFSGFSPSLTNSLMEGTLTAVNNYDGLVYHRKIVVSPDSVLSRSVGQMFTYLDQVMQSAIHELIVSAPPPHTPGQLCETNVFCSECYE